MAEPKSNTSETKQLKQAAVALTNHACTLSMQHIQDGMLRLQFNREVAYYAQGIVRDVEGGRKSVAQGVEALWGEHADLREKSWFYFKNGLGNGCRSFTNYGWGRHLLRIPWPSLYPWGWDSTTWRKQCLRERE